MRANLVPLVTGDFILFLNFVILKIWQNLHPRKKKKSQIYTRKNIQFFWVKKKKFNRKNKTKHCFESPIVEDYIGFFLKMHCFCRFVLTNCSRPTENNACDHLHIFHIMIGLKLWNYWCALLLTYMGCMEMKMGSLEIEIVSKL